MLKASVDVNHCKSLMKPKEPRQFTTQDMTHTCRLGKQVKEKLLFLFIAWFSN